MVKIETFQGTLKKLNNSRDSTVFVVYDGNGRSVGQLAMKHYAIPRSKGMGPDGDITNPPISYWWDQFELTLNKQEDKE